MTEYNLFCYSVKYNDENSFQQKRYRVFNKEVGKDRYYDLYKIVKEILPSQQTLFLSDYWKSITQEQWNKLLEIPEAKDFKEGFEYIAGIKIEKTENQLKDLEELPESYGSKEIADRVDLMIKHIKKLEEGRNI